MELEQAIFFSVVAICATVIAYPYAKKDANKKSVMEEMQERISKNK